MVEIASHIRPAVGHGDNQREKLEESCRLRPSRWMIWKLGVDDKFAGHLTDRSYILNLDGMYVCMIIITCIAQSQ
jgi:hypothetical protein